MSLNSPRPPRPPRPGGGRPGTRPAGPPRNSGIQPGAAGPAGGKSDFGDTRTVILSRKNMGMQQKKKGGGGGPGAAPSSAAAAPAPAAAPQLPKAKVVNNTVSCVKCAGSFPILGDEYYGAVVECPDCSAEFVIPSKAEVMAQAPAAPAAPAAAPAPAPAAPAAPPAASAPAAPAPAAQEAPAAPAPAPAKEPAAKSAPPAAQKKKKTQYPKESSAKSAPKKRKPVKRVPPFVETELEDEEEVFVCETEKGGSGGSVLAAVMALLAGVAGAIVPVLGLSSPLNMIIPGVAGLVFAVVAFVVTKGGGGDKALVVTNNRVFAKSGKWFAQSDLD